MDHLTNTKEMVDFIDSYFANSNVNVMIDVFHIDKADETIHKSIALANEKLSYVHISDSDRKIPGEGAFVFEEVFSVLINAEYKGYITPEINQFADSLQAARKSLKYLKEWV